MLSMLKRLVTPQTDSHAKTRSKRKYVCHHCFKYGHIRPFCYKLNKELDARAEKSSKKAKNNVQSTKKKPEQVWKPKSVESKCLVV